MAFGAKIKLSPNTSGAAAFRREIQQFVNKATKDNPVTTKVTLDISNPKQQLKTVQSKLNQSDGLTIKIKEVDAKPAINKLRKDIQYMLSGLNIVGLKDFLQADGIDDAVDGIKEAKQTSTEWATQMKIVGDISNKLSSTYKSALSGDKMVVDNAALSDITSRYNEWQAKVETLRTSKAAMSREDIENLQREGIEIQRQISFIQEKQAAEKRSSKETKSGYDDELLLAQRVVSLKGQIQRFIVANGKAYRVHGVELDAMLSQLESGAISSSDALRKLKIRLDEIKMSSQSSGLMGDTFSDTMKKGWERFGGWSLVTKSMTSAYRAIKKVLEAVKELDYAMTELKKVTDLSNDAYKDYLETASKLSQSIGVSLVDTITSTSDFSRLGYNLNDATALAEAALVYKNVGDGIDDISEASASLISTIKAFEKFGVSAENAMNIVDKFNEVGNNFAISSEGIGTALQISASSLAAANNNLDETIALITGMNAVVQDPNKVGTALKTVSMYLRAAKTEAEDAGEATDGMASSVSELRDELLTLTKGKVDIMIDDKTFKSTYQIMKELSEVWSSLSDVDTANILELIGGKRNATAVTSLITNFKDAEDALKTSISSAGSAFAENEKYLDSIAGKLNVLKSQFESISNNLLDSGFVKVILDIGIALSNVLEILSEFPFVMTTIAAIAALIGKTQQANSVAQLTERIMLQRAAIISEGAATDQLSLSISALNMQKKKLLVTSLQEKLLLNEITQEEYKGIIANLGLASAEGAVTVANKGLAASFKSLMASIPIWGWISLGITFIIELSSVLIGLVGNIEKTEEKIIKLKESISGTIDEINRISSDYQSLNKSAKDIIPRFTELAKGVDEFGNNVSLTDENYEEFISLNNQLAEIFPDLTMGYDENGRALLDISYSSDTLNESLQSLLETAKQLANQKIVDESFPNLVNSANELVDTYKNGSNFLETALSTTKSFFNIDNLKSVLDILIDINKQKEDAESGSSSNKSGVIGFNPNKIIPNNSPWAILDDASANRTAYKARVEKEAKLYEEQIKNAWSKITPAVVAWLDTDLQFQTLNTNVQGAIKKLVSDINYGEVIDGKVTSEKITAWISESIITPIQNATPEAQAVLVAMFDVSKAYKDGKITVGQYVELYNAAIEDLKRNNVSDAVIENLTIAIDHKSVTDNINKVKAVLSDEEDALVNDLSAEELEIAREIIVTGNIKDIKMDDLREKIEEYKLANADMVDVLDFGDMITGLDKAVEGIDKLISAMSKLKDGTALNKKELAELAFEFPDLLKQANLFTDGSIAGQKKMLAVILDTYEKEYDAQIDTKIAELKAAMQVADDQLKLEAEKQAALDEIALAGTNGKIMNEKALTDAVAKYNDLQAKNYISLENGNLAVNEEAINDKIEQESDGAEKTVEGVYKPFGQAVSDSTAEGVNGALKGVGAFFGALFKMFANGGNKLTATWQNTWEAIKAGEVTTFGGLWDTIQGNWKAAEEQIRADAKKEAAVKVKVTWNGNTPSIDGQSVQEWVSNQKEASNQMINRINQYKTELQTTIDNLNDLKGLNLSDIYGSPSNKKDDIEEYIADIDKYYAAIKKLEEIQIRHANLAKELENTTDPAKKIKLERQLIEVYKDEIEAEQNLINLKAKSIEETAKALRKLGFEIEYDKNRNSLYVANMEHLNKLTAEKKGKYKSLQEATNALREDTEELIDSIETLNDENIDAVDNIQDLEDAIDDSKDNIIADIQEMVDAADGALSGAQNFYDTIMDAAEEYNKYGFMTVDTYQAILSVGNQYLSYLYDENGALVMNEEAVEKLIAAKVDNLAITQAMSIVDTVKENLDNAEALKKLADATYEASGATWDLVYAELAALQLDPELYDAYYKQIRAIQEMAEATKKSIGKNTDKIDEQRDNEKAALEEILDLTQELIRYETEEKIKALEDQISMYQEIIDKKKEALQLTKEEEDYQKSVEEKVKDIAKLQAKIDQLSLDDSREAAAERAKLMEELQDKQSDLSDFQSDHSTDKIIDALDKDAETYEEMIQPEIEKLEDSISSTEKVYQAAIERISTSWYTLYGDLIAWNTEAGNSINSEITANWQTALGAAMKYGSFVGALAHYDENFATGAIGGIGGGLVSGITSALSGVGQIFPLIKDVVNIIDDIGDKIADATDSETLSKIFSYDDEIYQIIDFAETISDNIGSFVNLGSIAPIVPAIANGVEDLFDFIKDNMDNQPLVFNPEINVSLSGAFDSLESIARLGDQIADIALDKLYDAFKLKGI